MTLFKSQSGITSSRLPTDTNGTGGATNISSFTAPHTIQGINNGSTQYALLATLPKQYCLLQMMILFKY